MTALDVARLKRDFPILEREVNGKRARLPRLRVVGAKAPRRARRDGRRVPQPLRQHPPRRVHDRRGGDRRVRGRARARSRASSTRRAPTRSCSRATRPSRSTSSRTRGRAANLQAGDAIVLSHMEHHANVVPWQMLAAERGIELRWIPLTPDFRLDLTDLDALLDGAQPARDQRDVERARHDQRHPAAGRRRARARRAGARRRVPVRPARRRPTCRPGTPTSSRSRRTRCSARPGSARCGRRYELLDAMPPFLGGGEMIRDVRLDGFTTNDAAVEVRGRHARDRRGRRLRRRDRLHLRASAWTRSGPTSGRSPATRSRRCDDRFGDSLTIYGPTDVDVRGGAVSFLFDGIHAHDISQVLDEDAVCVRAGHHCAKPLMRQLGVMQHPSHHLAPYVRCMYIRPWPTCTSLGTPPRPAPI